MTEMNLRAIKSMGSPVSKCKTSVRASLASVTTTTMLPRADLPDEARAERQIRSSDHGSLRSDRAKHQMALRVALQRCENFLFTQILADRLRNSDRIS